MPRSSKVHTVDEVDAGAERRRRMNRFVHLVRADVEVGAGVGDGVETS
jgi:hypothetical protein